MRADTSDGRADARRPSPRLAALAPSPAGRARGILALTLLLAACSVEQAYEAPPIPQPAAWKNQVADTPAWPSPDWWKKFNSKRLDELMEQAREANFDIRAAAARVAQADAQLRINGASLLPSLSASGSGTRSRSAFGESTRTSGVSSSSVSSSALHANSFGLSLSASYEIDFWGKNRALLHAYENSAIQSRYDARTAQLTVQSSVATTYFDMVGQAERLLVARETVANSERVLEAFRDRLAAGTATALDVAQQESVVSAQRATIPPIEQTISQDANALAILTGKAPEEMGLVPEVLSSITLPVIQPGLPSELLARRPDVRSAEHALMAANANIANARAQLLPSISLTASGGFSSVALGALLQHTGLVWAAGASLAQTLFDGGKLEGNVDLTRAKYEELAQTYSKAVVSALSDVENSLVAVQKTGALEDAQRANYATSRNAHEIAEAQLKGGTVDITTVLNTQKALFSAQDALAQARLLHLQAVVGLYKAMGGGWDEPVQEPEWDPLTTPISKAISD
jgi:NodT family efflux transporter outer membrane factor (OMF) lipoprotein